MRGSTHVAVSVFLSLNSVLTTRSHCYQSKWRWVNPRDFLRGFHENNSITMACDINIGFGKVRPRIRREASL
ncbi:hypothetical protein GOODEAATRI_033282 [Goodea atripinnis]|uniref:Secreted protein n=1 Tax=Goodea atripinnis TaxID=208336 RepID=A0ABV0Q332_9TELE